MVGRVWVRVLDQTDKVFGGLHILVKAKFVTGAELKVDGGISAM